MKLIYRGIGTIVLSHPVENCRLLRLTFNQVIYVLVVSMLAGWLLQAVISQGIFVLMFSIFSILYFLHFFPSKDMPLIILLDGDHMQFGTQLIHPLIIQAVSKAPCIMPLSSLYPFGSLLVGLMSLNCKNVSLLGFLSRFIS